MSYPKKIRLKIIWTQPMLEQYYKQFNTYENRAIYKLVEVNSKEEEEYMLEINRRDAAVIPDIINNWKEEEQESDKTLTEVLKDALKDIRSVKE